MFVLLLSASQTAHGFEARARHARADGSGS